MTDESFSAILGLIVAATIGILVFVDAKRITNSNYSIGSPILWAIGVTLLAILILPTYLLRRSKIFKSYPEATGEIKLFLSPVVGWLVFSMLLIWTIFTLSFSVLVGDENGIDNGSHIEESHSVSGVISSFECGDYCWVSLAGTDALYLCADPCLENDEIREGVNVRLYWRESVLDLGGGEDTYRVIEQISLE